MSRSRRGEKAPGFEYWSKRPGNKHGAGGLGKSQKRQTHKAERQQHKRLTEEKI